MHNLEHAKIALNLILHGIFFQLQFIPNDLPLLRFRCSETKLGNYTFLTRIISKTICIRDFKSWSTG